MGAISGARVKLLFDGKEAGWATGCQVRTERGLFPVDVLGNGDVEEYEFTGRRHTMQAQFTALKGVSLKSMGLAPKGTGATGTANAINFPALTGELYDEVSDEPIESLEGIKLQSDGWSINKGGVLSRDTSFVFTIRLDHNGE